MSDEADDQERSHSRGSAGRVSQPSSRNSRTTSRHGSDMAADIEFENPRESSGQIGENDPAELFSDDENEPSMAAPIGNEPGDEYVGHDYGAVERDGSDEERGEPEAALEGGDREDEEDEDVTKESSPQERDAAASESDEDRDDEQEGEIIDDIEGTTAVEERREGGAGGDVGVMNDFSETSVLPVSNVAEEKEGPADDTIAEDVSDAPIPSVHSERSAFGKPIDAEKSLRSKFDGLWMEGQDGNRSNPVHREVNTSRNSMLYCLYACSHYVNAQAYNRLHTAQLHQILKIIEKRVFLAAVSLRKNVETDKDQHGETSYAGSRGSSQQSGRHSSRRGSAGAPAKTDGSVSDGNKSTSAFEVLRERICQPKLMLDYVPEKFVDDVMEWPMPTTVDEYQMLAAELEEFVEDLYI